MLNVASLAWQWHLLSIMVCLSLLSVLLVFLLLVTSLSIKDNKISLHVSMFENGYLHTQLHESFHTTKNVLPRTAYFDDRPRDGHYNVTVILVHVRKTILYNSGIFGCGIDNHNSTHFVVELMEIYETFVHWQFPQLTHDEVMITCYDLPARNGSHPFIVYFDGSTNSSYLVHSEHPIVIHSNNEAKNKSSLVVCTMAFDDPPWIMSWLKYQKEIGVDFVHIYAQESFVPQGMDKLQEYLQEGFVTVDVWKAYLNFSETYYYSQPLLYVDCIYRYRGVFDYAFLLDTDDFFNPVLPENNIHFYTDLLFNESIGSISFQWLHYFPDCGLTQKQELITDGNLTKYLITFDNVNYNYKGLHLLSAVTQVHIHEVASNSLLPDYSKAVVPLEVAYVSHIRKGNSKKAPPCEVPRPRRRRRRRRRRHHQDDNAGVVLMVVAIVVVCFFCCCGLFLSIAGLIDDDEIT